MQPSPYLPIVSFQSEETAAVAGRSTVRTSALDAELQAVSLTLSQILTNLAVIQRDDTGLRDLVVTTQSLSANVKALFAGGINPRGTWLTATAYAVKDVVETLTPLISYICVVAHTSGVFATDRTAGKWMVLGSEPGSVVLTDLTLSTGGITLSTNNTQDLAATGNRFRSGYFGTTVFAGTGVVTPLVDATGALLLRSGGTGALQFSSATGVISCNSDNTTSLGSAVLRWVSGYFTAIDSGTTGSLSFRTNNGSTQFRVDHTAGAIVNTLRVTGGIAGQHPFFESQGEANSGIRIITSGAGPVWFEAPGGTYQFQILATAGANRSITVTGSNGGNPTISTTAGLLAITPAVVMASTLLVTGGVTPNFISGEQAVPTGGAINVVAHGLGLTPRLVVVILRCKVSELNYFVGDEVLVCTMGTSSCSVSTEGSTSLILITTATPQILNKTTAVAATITPANWKYVFRAWS